MFDFNDIGIKSPEDLQEALSIVTSAESFKQQFLGMVDRWGLDNALDTLGMALCGDDELKPLINFTKKMVPAGPTNDPWESYDLVDLYPVKPARMTPEEYALFEELNRGEEE